MPCNRTLYEHGAAHKIVEEVFTNRHGRLFAELLHQEALQLTATDEHTTHNPTAPQPIDATQLNLDPPIHCHPEVLVSHRSARLTVHSRLLIVQHHQGG